MREIALTRGQVALVDDEDFERVAALRWIAKPSSSGKWYGMRSVTRDGRATSLYLHRFIADAPRGSLVDHANGNPLDNRRCNLRLCTSSQNAMNSSRAPGVSGLRGVHIFRGRWRLRIETGVGGVITGGASSREIAARAYDALAREFHGEFAVLNFPKETL